jgi:hypothetical protein
MTMKEVIAAWGIKRIQPLPIGYAVHTVVENVPLDLKSIVNAVGSKSSCWQEPNHHIVPIGLG